MIKMTRSCSEDDRKVLIGQFLLFSCAGAVDRAVRDFVVQILAARRRQTAQDSQLETNAALINRSYQFG